MKEEPVFDVNIFRNIFNDNYRYLCYFAKGYVSNDYIIEEIVSESFVKLWNNRDNLKNRDSVKGYLYQSVRNACIDYYRKENKQINNTTNIDDNPVVCTTLADLGEDPLNYLISKENETKILNAIENLPDRYRQTLKLSRFDKHSYEEIARIMDISTNTVKSNLREAISKLRKELGDTLMLLFLIV
ncbi:RNA polymerase sigma-70 factor [uncultured Dysgonomonas sp.]|uniref:RNA polymerase ECF-type sigma factor n=1 Tax=uncultured Dysgonomonas sp. TaxID=206096 RepID=A0A212ITJ3_9BACT|nr:RNA polymerase sigma-70 factor [uncultured Dysgonomonas sp.]SBV90528.1 RNA polymerase ECF-type sigma factor [uncultured Dysgonomonas sp.]